MDRRNFIKETLATTGSIVLTGTAFVACKGGGKKAGEQSQETSIKDNPAIKKPGMTYRVLGKSGLEVSEIGLGAEWLERHSAEECKQLVSLCDDAGINIIDCWMSNPEVRSNLGAALEGRREHWYIQGHLGSTWQGGQYVRTRSMDKVKEAFQDLLTRLKTDYIDIGMIHFVDEIDEWERITKNEFMDYVNELKNKGIIRHIGMSTHNPLVARKAAESGFVEVILFSLNPAYDMLPASESIFGNKYEKTENGISSERAELYNVCEQNNVGITVMKGFAGGRLFDEKLSPFGVALTPVQCIHYALTRPAVASILVGIESSEQLQESLAYEIATDEEKNFGAIIANAPSHAYGGQCTYCGHCKPCPQNIDIAMVNKYYDLATMQPEVPQSVKRHYLDLKYHASDCNDCAACEPRCPFKVKIVERMKMTKDLFEI